VIDYRSNGAFPEAVGLVSGLKPTRNQNYGLLSSLNRARIFSYYIVYSSLGLTVPVFIYRKMKYKLYKFFKKHG
jgi:hypothetical protein